VLGARNTIRSKASDKGNCWLGYFKDKGTGFPVFRGPRPETVRRVQIGLAVFSEETSTAWRKYENTLEGFFQTDTPGFEPEER
jgi:hypothetical protein